MRYILFPSDVIFPPRWEDDITWEEDISHLLPVLRDEVWVGLYIDTWSNEGWSVDVGFKFDEYYTKTKKPLKTIFPLLNTTPMFPGQSGHFVPETLELYLAKEI